MKYLLFDIGATRSRFSTSDGAGISDVVECNTPQNFDEALQTLADTALSLTDDGFELAYGGVAGALNKEKSGLFEPPNLPHWHNRNFVEGFSSLIACPVYIENDTALVGLGEAVHGAGVGHEIVMYMTVSTGVNGVKIAHQQIDESSVGFETGQQIIDISEHLDIGTINMGSLEEYIGGKKLEERYGKPPSELEDEKIWRQIAEATAVGIYNSVLHWSPNVVVLGGGVLPKLPMNVVRDKVTQLVTEVFPDYPDVVMSKLGDKAAMYGALHMITSR